MSFTTSTQVRFAHVDAAAIVFYPRYFEMLNGAVEDWFASMGHDFHLLHVARGIGTPTVRIECDFASPSELGDLLKIEISPRELGRSSCRYDFIFSCNGQERLRGSAVLVCIDLGTRASIPWPDALRSEMEALGAQPRR
jgi:4-hydroxybenzoyl-CoA thioesterase